MFTATLYNNTGFNLMNIPDKPSLLESAADSTKDVPAMDILQLYYNPVIRIRAFENDVRFADYVKLIDGDGNVAYYYIEDYKMTSGDTIELNVSMEPWLTAGGIDNIEFLDGITNRHHVADDSDPFLYTEDDDIFVPSEPTTIKKQADLFKPDYLHDDAAGAAVMVVLSSTDLDNGANFKYDVWADGTDEGAGKQGSVTYGGTFAQWSGGNIYHEVPFMANYPAILGNPFCVTIAKTSGGVNSIYDKILKIIANNGANLINYVYMIPKQWLNYVTNSESAHVAKVVRMNSVKKAEDYQLESTFAGVKNKRACGGKYNTEIFLSSGSGQVKEIRDDHLLFVPDENNHLHNTVTGYGDVRPGGGVTFTFQQKNVPEVADPMDGGRWMEQACGIAGIDGINQARASFYANMSQQLAENEVAVQFGSEPGANHLIPHIQLPHKMISTEIGAFSNRALSSRFGMTDGMYGGTIDPMSMDTEKLLGGVYAGNERAKSAYLRQAQIQNEINQFNSSHTLQGHVIGNITALPDLANNCLLHFSRRLSSKDRDKFDRILTMYGYRHTTMMDETFLKNRQKFNYVQTKGISVKCDTVPKSVRDGVCDAFNQGVRIWHVKPENHAYSDNPIVNDGGN